MAKLVQKLQALREIDLVITPSRRRWICYRDRHMPLELKPTHPLVERSGRWSQSSSDTLTASWCGVSLQFVFSGRSLLIRPGKRTERKDPWNGGTPMLIWTITPEGSEDSEPFIVQSADAEPLKEIILFDGDLVSPMGDCLYFVRIMLVDWASVFEVEAIVVESEECIRPFPSSPSPPLIKVLLIGDSISCGYTQASDHPTRGYYDAFPSVAQRLLHEQQNSFTVQIETIAYPGITLVNPTESEAEKGMARGMVDRFFHSSPWDATPLAEYEHPFIVIISLGTNDEACDIPAERFATALHDLIRRLLQLFQTSLRCLCVIHPFPDFTESQPSVLASSIPSVLDCIREEGRKEVTLHNFDISSTMSRGLTEDGLHPTSEGHKVLGRNLAGHLSTMRM